MNASQVDRKKLHPLVTFYEGTLPENHLGLSSYTGAEVFIAARQSRLQYLETMLHELIHFLLKHDGPPSASSEEAVEHLAVTTARKVLMLEASERPARTLAVAS